MSLELTVRLLGESDAPQQAAQQASITPVRLALLVWTTHHHPCAIEGRRAVVGPLDTFTVGAIDVGIFAQHLKRAGADAPELA